MKDVWKMAPHDGPHQIQTQPKSLVLTGYIRTSTVYPEYLAYVTWQLEGNKSNLASAI